MYDISKVIKTVKCKVSDVKCKSLLSDDSCEASIICQVQSIRNPSETPKLKLLHFIFYILHFAVISAVNNFDRGELTIVRNYNATIPSISAALL